MEPAYVSDGRGMAKVTAGLACEESGQILKLTWKDLHDGERAPTVREVNKSGHRGAYVTRPPIKETREGRDGGAAYRPEPDRSPLGGAPGGCFHSPLRLPALVGGGGRRQPLTSEHEETTEAAPRPDLSALARGSRPLPARARPDLCPGPSICTNRPLSPERPPCHGARGSWIAL